MEPGTEQPMLPEEESPPIFRTWPQAYGAVLIYLVFLLFALYFVTRAFTY